MAKITFGPSLSEARGKAADTVYTKTRGGNVVKALRLSNGAAGEGHRASIRRTTSYTLADNSYIYLPFETENYDVGDLAELSTNPNGLTIQRPGVYHVTATVYFFPAAAGLFLMNILSTRGPELANSLINTDTTHNVILVATNLVLLSKGEGVGVTIMQVTGANVTIPVMGPNNPVLAVHQLSTS